MGSPDSELSVLIVDDPSMADMNQTYLGHSGPTNVISFSMREGDFGNISPHLLGDVIISADTAFTEAQAAGMDPEERFDDLLIHGILHLFGYDHETDDDGARRMEDKALELKTLLQDLAD